MWGVWVTFRLSLVIGLFVPALDRVVMEWVLVGVGGCCWTVGWVVVGGGPCGRGARLEIGEVGGTVGGGECGTVGGGRLGLGSRGSSMIGDGSESFVAGL